MADDGSPVGIEVDDFVNEDKMALHLVNLVKDRLGIVALTQVHFRFDDHDEARVMVVSAARSSSPVFLKDGELERFFIRTGPSTTELRASQTQDYIGQRFRV